MKRDIQTIEDIKVLVNAFYDRIREDNLLAPVFFSKIQDNWQPHLEKMYAFWQTLLLEEHTYFGSPFPPHARLPVGQEHFDAWLHLWRMTVDEFFEGTKAGDAKWRAEKMAVLFHHKIDYYRNSDAKPLM